MSPLVLEHALILDSLIMLLIQSDMFKAFWFMVYPIVTFVNGPVNSHSTFCQVNGFFLAVGIESSGKFNLRTKELDPDGHLYLDRFFCAHDCNSYGSLHLRSQVFQ